MSDAPTQAPSIRLIIAVVADEFGLSGMELLSQRRAGAVARQVAMFIARRMTQHTSTVIGAHMGKRDKSTVLHGAEKTAALMSVDAVFRDRVHLIMDALTRTRVQPVATEPAT